MNFYPSYDQLLAEKVNAYPKQITIEEQKCEVMKNQSIFQNKKQ
jgi:hypothetical protein